MVFINRPFEEIAPVSLSPLTVGQVRLLLVKRNNVPATMMFHLKMLQGEDLVIGYQSLLHDFRPSRVKAITNGYRMKPFCFTYKQALLDYTTHSKLSFQSIGLKLSVVQKNTLVRKLVQDYWFFDRAYNSLYSNAITGFAQALQSSVDALSPFSLSQFLSATYLNHLKNQGLLNLSDAYEEGNLEQSLKEQDLLKVRLSHCEKELEKKLLLKCSHLDIPFHLGFSRVELVETIRDRYELCRQASLGSNLLANFQSGPDLSCHVQARIWLGPVIGSDESLMSLQTQVDKFKNQLHQDPDQI